MADHLAGETVPVTERRDDLGPCHVTGCEKPAVGGDVGESGDVLLCADHLPRANEEVPHESGYWEPPADDWFIDNAGGYE